ncbi:MAG: 4-hydroxybutyrate CoA-transferase [Lachnospiraceae bacterium]|nr:4-hydroxybutyrate CoA-transferase [Lachnospiraceae bacterium]
MSWRDAYQSKRVTANEAVSHIKSGDRIVLAHAAAEPMILVDAMAANADAYRDVEFVNLVCLTEAPYCAPEYQKNFRLNSLFVGAPARKAVAEGRADFTPVFFHEVPALLQTRLQPDATFLQLSPPNAHGYCSFGVSVDYTKTAAQKCGGINIAQINKHMPCTYGDSFIHVSELDYIVEHDETLVELQPPVLGDVEKAIGRNVASLIQDGDCLQLGIGSIPDAVLAGLTDKKDLGIYTEMFSDGVVDLVEAGVINNKHKNIHNGKLVATFLMGTQKLYDFVDHNPMVEMLSVDYVNDPRIAAQNDNLVAINACVQVDLLGQVVSDSIGLRQISGVGGQVDFVRAANMSKGGRAIMAMPSTTKGISKIVPFIAEGAAVTTNRFDVNYVVTEHGIAALKGRTLRERAAALIKIAHPDFREALAIEYEKRFHAKFKESEWVKG